MKMMKMMNHMIKFHSRGDMKIDEEKCKGCGLCRSVCPYENLGKLSVSNSKGYYPSYDKGVKCNNCGKCFMVCPDMAIEVDNDDYL